MTLWRDIDRQRKKSQKFRRKIAFLTNILIFPSKTPVGICSYNVHWEPHAKFQPNRMDSSRDRSQRVLIPKLENHKHLSAPGTLPNSAHLPQTNRKSRHLAGECASFKGIWHTSSKGMPRHAHGRWALVTVCGVDVSHAYVVRTERSAYVTSM